jgi:hypothetical protein
MQSIPSVRRVDERTGIALVPAILIVSGLAVFSAALLSAVLSGSRTVVHQSEEYQVSSAVESVAALAAETLWSGYVAGQGGAAGDIESFRTYLSERAIENAPPGGLPGPEEGKELLPELGLPQEEGRTRLNHVNLDTVRVVRRDAGDATQLFLTVSASTTRGDGLVNPALNRAVQQVYTVEPADFPGFEYALLANNVNCVFCHARVDSARRWWNTDPELLGSFPRVKVGTLESLLLRHNMDGSSTINDFDADSYIAGTLYSRGLAATSEGSPITNWNALSFKSHPFDDQGNIIENSFGLGLSPFSPSPKPAVPLENLYLGYENDYSSQVDGYLPDHFPPPFPDDGGVDPTSGTFDQAAVGNKRVDDSEFLEIAAAATGTVTGIVNKTGPGELIDSAADYALAITTGNQPQGLRMGDTGGLGIQGNVLLTGKRDNPIVIDGTLAIDGDLVIQGFIKGSGQIYVRGNIYVPSDLMYADGKTYLAGDVAGQPTGPRSFGIAADGTRNALALTAGGNILIGDFQRPATMQADGTRQVPGELEIVDGNPSGEWNFALAEMAIFNRAEWAKTQPTLPSGNGQVKNPGYVPGYVPRYYGFGEDTIIPLFKSGHFDPVTQAWLGPEMPISWNLNQLVYADPNNPVDPLLYNADGSPKAVTSSLAHTGGWLDPSVYKLAVEYLEDHRPQQSPLLIDGLMYTNNAIFSIVYRDSAYAGMMLMNGSIVAADLGMLVMGKKDGAGVFPNHSPVGNYAIGLQLNYDERLKNALKIKNPLQVQLKRTYWNPTANLL